MHLIWKLLQKNVKIPQCILITEFELFKPHLEPIPFGNPITRLWKLLFALFRHSVESSEANC
jgi:hypothetical protein